MPKESHRIAGYVRGLADALSLTSAERRVLQFLIAGCVVGIGVQLIQQHIDSPAKFDYSATDSVFAALHAVPPADEPAVPDREARATQGPVRVNSASKAELMDLPGIGEVTAERIILERQDHGAFRSVDDLTRVRGIGAKRIERLRPLVIID